MGMGVQGRSEFLSGFVSISGRPNVGKSTFLNAVLGTKVSIVAHRPQTTRNRIIGIKTIPESQIVFVDTPGIHRPRHGLGAKMVKAARQAMKDVDVVLLMVEPRMPGPEDKALVRTLKHLKKPVLLLVNKTDKVKKPELLPVMDAYATLHPFDRVIPISALKGEGLDVALHETLRFLRPGPKYYPEGLVTDRLERFLVAEIVREKIIRATSEEVPHSVAVEVLVWEESKKGPISISVNIYVEKQSQKGIIIGSKGSLLKSVGTSARRDIERLLGARVFLELWVKVRRRWRDDTSALSELGID